MKGVVAVQFELVPCEAVQTTLVGQRILAEAGHLFYEHGITATGVDLIVDQAGTTKRTLYQRFGSKDGLVAAYLQQRAHRWQLELLATLSDPSPVEAIEVVYRQARGWARVGGRGCAFINAWAELGPADSAGVAVVLAEKRWMLELFTEMAGGDDQLGRTLHLLYEGAQISAAMTRDHQAFHTAERLSRSLLRPCA